MKEKSHNLLEDKERGRQVKSMLVSWYHSPKRVDYKTLTFFFVH